MKEITFTFTPENANGLINLLDDLPTKFGVYLLVQDLKKQIQEQVAANESIPKVEM